MKKGQQWEMRFRSEQKLTGTRVLCLGRGLCCHHVMSSYQADLAPARNDAPGKSPDSLGLSPSSLPHALPAHCLLTLTLHLILEPEQNKPTRRWVSNLVWLKMPQIWGQRILSLNFPLFSSPRPPRFAEREAHWGHPGQPAASLGAPAQAEPPRVLSALCQAAPENDRPQTDCNGTCAAIASHKENRDRHESSPTPTRDIQGLVLAEKSEFTDNVFLLPIALLFWGEIWHLKNLLWKSILKRKGFRIIDLFYAYCL